MLNKIIVDNELIRVSLLKESSNNYLKASLKRIESKNEMLLDSCFELDIETINDTSSRTFFNKLDAYNYFDLLINCKIS